MARQAALVPGAGSARSTGAEIETVEGLADGSDGSPATSRRRSSPTAPRSAGSARPGMLMAADALLAANPDADDAAIRDGSAACCAAAPAT